MVYVLSFTFIHFLIWFRLFLIHKPFLYIFSYSILFFVLFFYQQQYLLLMYSFFVVFSKLRFFISCNSFSDYLNCMQHFCTKDLNSENISIRPTFLNAMIFSYFNLHLLCEHIYEYFLHSNELDVPFVFVLICDHYELLDWNLPPPLEILEWRFPLKPDSQIKIDIKEKKKII